MRQTITMRRLQRQLPILQRQMKQAYLTREAMQTGDRKGSTEGAADGTVENYYKIQQENFIAGGQVEKEVPVADYVMLDNMIEAGK